MKLRKKLLLSCAALAACATTMVSTTYAWYVNNPTAYANGATGSTADTDTTGSLSISKTGDNGSWYKSITLTDANNANLSPTHYIDGNFFTLDDSAGTADDPVDVTVNDNVNNNYIKITLYLKADANGTVDLVLTTTNTTPAENYKSQASLSDTNKAPVGKGESWYSDAYNAMYIERVIYTTTTDPYDTTATAVNTLVGETDTYSRTAAGTVSITTGGNANAYYEEIKEETLSDAAKTVPATANMGQIALTANTPVKVEYRIWLEGADPDCFNACTNQSFTFALKYNFTKS